MKKWHVQCANGPMKTNQSCRVKKLCALAAAAIVASVLNALPVSALDNPINPDSPSPNAGVSAGHRAAGDSTARRPGNLPKYEPQSHSSTGVSNKTP